MQQEQQQQEQEQQLLLQQQQQQQRQQRHHTNSNNSSNNNSSNNNSSNTQQQHTAATHSSNHSSNHNNPVGVHTLGKYQFLNAVLQVPMLIFKKMALISIPSRSNMVIYLDIVDNIHLVRLDQQLPPPLHRLLLPMFPHLRPG